MAVRRVRDDRRGVVPRELYEPLARLGNYPNAGSASSVENYMLATRVRAAGFALRELREVAVHDIAFQEWREQRVAAHPSGERDPYFSADELTDWQAERRRLDSLLRDWEPV